MDPLLGTILIWPLPWVPQGWQLCDGTLLSVNQNQALFALIGTIYGGNGQTTFAVPDFRTRVPIGAQTVTQVGQQTGAAAATVVATGAGAVTIGVNNLPSHNHSLSGASVSIAVPVNSTGGTNTDTPGPTTVLTKGTVQGGPVNTTSKQYTTAAADTTLLPFNANLTGANTGNTGAGTPLPVNVSVPVTISTMQPSLSVNFIICTNGIFPSRP
ncbi:phage tail protein [Pedobacter jeongneungensis]|uniref:phage tail protein n=1 Tax=Pedobacter jeongneungensis TaxID=947309 RepID=UPI00068F023A|nr:tail fiber protein [Pedobacter jeongneungensis]